MLVGRGRSIRRRSLCLWPENALENDRETGLRGNPHRMIAVDACVVKNSDASTRRVPLKNNRGFRASLVVCTVLAGLSGCATSTRRKMSSGSTAPRVRRKTSPRSPRSSTPIRRIQKAITSVARLTAAPAIRAAPSRISTRRCSSTRAFIRPMPTARWSIATPGSSSRPCRTTTPPCRSIQATMWR